MYPQSIRHLLCGKEIVFHLHFSIDTKEAGDHMFCFDNSFSRFSNKLTFFEIITEEPDPTWEKLNELDTAPAEDGQYEYEYKLEIFKVRMLD